MLILGNKSTQARSELCELHGCLLKELRQKNLSESRLASFYKETETKHGGCSVQQLGTEAYILRFQETR
jgi:hypothetical protein